jgi:hypothetical protein
LAGMERAAGGDQRLVIRLSFVLRLNVPPFLEPVNSTRAALRFYARCRLALRAHPKAGARPAGSARRVLSPDIGYASINVGHRRFSVYVAVGAV